MNRMKLRILVHQTETVCSNTGKSKGKVHLEQATKVQRASRGVALLFL